MEIIEIKKLLDETKHFKPMDLPENWNFEKPINEKIIEYTRKLGFFLCDYEIYIDKKGKEQSKLGKNAVSNSQIRNFFGETKRIQMQITGKENDELSWENIKSSFHLLRPKLAYSSGRVLAKTKGSRIKDFANVLDYSVKSVRADEPNASMRFLRFVDFFESILAYHKSFGGKEN
jgi:CRISPR-associated protein Csm2